MAWTPRLNVICGRCGKPRSLTHVCVSSSSRKATVKTSWSFGKCQRCHKTITNPLTHNCHPKSDFKGRRAAHEKQQKPGARAAKRKQRPKHDYMACNDPGCPRPLCVAFKRGYKIGDREGYERGFRTGWDAGFAAGQAACPRAHQ